MPIDALKIRTYFLYKSNETALGKARCGRIKNFIAPYIFFMLKLSAIRAWQEVEENWKICRQRIYRRKRREKNILN